MTREEAIAIIRQEYLCVNKDCGIERSCGKCDLAMPSKEPILEAYEMAIEALSAEPCEDAISRQAALDAFNLSEKTRKYGGDHSGYDTMMLYEIQDVIEDLPFVTPACSEKPNNCEDAISRQAVLDIVDSYSGSRSNVEDVTQDIISDIMALPPVTPKQKMGHWEWVMYDSNPNIGNWHCSECRTIIPHMPNGTDNTPTYKWCPMCGAKMEDVTDINAGNMSENPTGSNCTACILDGTDACSRGAGRAVDGRVCEDFVGESEEE